MLNDSHHRTEAINPAGSYIVQAPAGSGKTEILTQRYLKLLSRVSAPEQIIALTFTRKAANEMRERILRALRQAAARTQATSAHQSVTLAIASDALKRDAELHWQLLNQPNRLRIITIDSLCQTLTTAIPLQEKEIPYAKISEKPQKHYLAAAHACLNFALKNSQYHESLKILLHHVDNRQDKLLALFQDLLTNRDQWLHLLYQAQEQDKKTYEQALALILQHELCRLKNSIPREYAYQLTSLVRQLTAIETTSHSLLNHLSSFHELTIPLAACLSHLLLTSQNTLRKAFDHHVGLKRGVCPDALYNELKADSKLLLEKLSELPDFVEALIRVKNLPPPYYDAEQWQVLQALFTLLPLLAAHLHLVFTEHNEVDFTAISSQALHALGSEDDPTDLALYLDNSIHHLLIDEFQDTSIQQFHLLAKLVQGWQPQEGKTLFVVGDPMQSIYRFRAAEVGLFLRAKEYGIGPVKLTPLELCCNFRSTATIVDWVNRQFKTIFPQTDDIESGAVRFHASTHVQPSTTTSQVIALQHADRMQEAEALVTQIKLELETHPNDNIAILVRSRNQLAEIVPLLRNRNIPFQGVEIDKLSTLPHLRDVWSLTQALLMPANRLAWLALLRSPWSGIELADILSIAQFSKNKSIYFALSQLNRIEGLTHEGRLRAQFLYDVMDHALSQRHQVSLVDWVIQTLHALHLDHVLNDTQQDELEQYWLLLNQFERHGQIEDIEQFSAEFNKLYSQQVIPSRLQIMTIHKSKGLEFDCVFLPGLSTRPALMDTPMLRWLKLPSQNQEEIILLSPIKAAHHDHCLLYDYLGKLDAEKSSYELQRLLYVAVTRAKKRLYLFDHSEKITQGTFRGLLQHQEFSSPPKEISQDEQRKTLPTLYRLPIDFYQTSPLKEVSTNPLSSLTLTSSTPRLLGIIAHELLQWICDHHPENIHSIPWELAKNQLRLLGLDDKELPLALETLKTQLSELFHDPIGQWIIKQHLDEKNEYELLIHHDPDFSLQIIDRTFCENGKRWIIDFKTGDDHPEAEKHHRRQVNQYAKLFAIHDNKPIHCGLYYLANNRWITWEYAMIPVLSVD